MIENISTTSTDQTNTIDSLIKERSKYNTPPTKAFTASGAEIMASFDPSNPKQIEIKANPGTNLKDRRSNRVAITGAAKFQDSNIRSVRSTGTGSTTERTDTLEYVGGISFCPVEDLRLDNNREESERRQRLLTPDIRYKALWDLLTVVENLNKAGFSMPDIKSDMIKFYNEEVVIIDTLVLPAERYRENWSDRYIIDSVLQILGGQKLLGDKHESIRKEIESRMTMQSSTQEFKSQLFSILNRYKDHNINGIPFIEPKRSDPKSKPEICENPALTELQRFSHFSLGDIHTDIHDETRRVKFVLVELDNGSKLKYELTKRGRVVSARLSHPKGDQIVTTNFNHNSINTPNDNHRLSRFYRTVDRIKRIHDTKRLFAYEQKSGRQRALELKPKNLPIGSADPEILSSVDQTSNKPTPIVFLSSYVPTRKGYQYRALKYLKSLY